MREIKFKAWHNINKKFISFYESDLKMHENGQIYAGGMNVTDRITLLQYTGLKDCNGTEIYEGDIVQPNDINGVLYVDWYQAESRYAAYYPRTINGIRNYTLALYHPDTLEVIGNIYENPDLLNQPAPKNSHHEAELEGEVHDE